MKHGMRSRAHFFPLSPADMEPAGWLREVLVRQARGLTGNLEHAGFPYNTRGWAAPLIRHRKGTGWWPYEQYGYWIDGMLRCGLLLDDPVLLRKARHQLRYVLRHQRRDGFLGPDLLRRPENNFLWPYVMLARALMAEYLAGKDKGILRALTRHYLCKPINPRYLREIANLEGMLFVYGHTGDKRLLHAAREAYVAFNNQAKTNEFEAERGETEVLERELLSPRPSCMHGVTYNEIAKLGAILFMYTGNKRALAAARNAYAKIDTHHLLVSGVNSSSERLTGRKPLDSHETCDIADYTWSVGYLLQATGEARYGDRMERACLNGGLGAVTPDFKALQYFSCPNQVIADKTSNHNLFNFGKAWMSYRPNPGTACCAGNVHRIMPNYAARMWQATAGGGLAAVLYGPGRISFRPPGSRRPLTVIQETGFPFSESVCFSFRMDKPVSFSFSMRIPAWCRQASLYLNGRPHKRTGLKAGKFVTLKRMFQPDDRLELRLPMSLSLSHWGSGVALELGPLVFSLPVKARCRVDRKDRRSSPQFPAWNMYPASPWNYALALNQATLQTQARLIRGPLEGYPWTVETAPLRVQVPARRVRGWVLNKVKDAHVAYVLPNGMLYYKTDVPGTITLTPDLPDPDSLVERLEPDLETIELVPYGCTQLRMTIFPVCG